MDASPIPRASRLARPGRNPPRSRERVQAHKAGTYSVRERPPDPVVDTFLLPQRVHDRVIKTFLVPEWIQDRVVRTFLVRERVDNRVVRTFFIRRRLQALFVGTFSLPKRAAAPFVRTFFIPERLHDRSVRKLIILRFRDFCRTPRLKKDLDPPLFSTGSRQKWARCGLLVGSLFRRCVRGHQTQRREERGGLQLTAKCCS